MALVLIPAAARAATITFGEVAPGPLNGVTIGNVTFGFQISGVDSLDATIGLIGGPGVTPLNDPPNIEGNSAGILTLNFAAPVGFVQFGAHLSIAGAVPAGLTVQFFDNVLTPIGGPIALDMVLSPAFAGGLFSASAPGIARAVIDFNQAAAARFTLDTLVYEDQVVPEPATMLLVGSGLATALVRRRNRNRR